jgi:GNAT superfamily N-acetyltransferase
MKYDVPMTYHVYTLKNKDDIISYAILIYIESGIKRYFDRNTTICTNLHWWFEYIQTMEKYRNKGYGKKLVTYIKEHINEPIVLVSYKYKLLFWCKSKFRIIYWDMFEQDEFYMVCNVNDIDTYKHIHDHLYPGEFLTDKWYISKLLTGELNITSKTQYVDNNMFLYMEELNEITNAFLKEIKQ